MKAYRIEPGPGQESVWDYPRPPRTEDFHGHIVVIFNHVTIADTTRSKRVLETSHPPIYYIHPHDVHIENLIQCPGTSFCEWKGKAHYYTIIAGRRKAEKAAWYNRNQAVFTVAGSPVISLVHSRVHRVQNIGNHHRFY